MKQLDLWWEPIIKEFEIFKEQSVSELVPRPERKKVVRSKWVYVVKWKENREVEKQKARMVAKGFT